MSRLLAALVLALLLVQATGLAALARPAACAAACDDDGPDGRCPPVSDSCACCAQLGTPAPAARPGDVAVFRTPTRAMSPEVAAMPASADPREINHVPLRSLA